MVSEMEMVLRCKNFDTGDDWSGNLNVLEEHDLCGARNQ